MSKSAIAEYGLGPQEVPVGLLAPSATNPRKWFDDKKLAELAESVKQKGIVQRLLVRPRLDKLEIVAGERRWRAAQTAGLAKVPVEIKEISDEETLELQIVENDQREDVHFLEQALGYCDLSTRRNLTAAQVAERVGKTPQFVAGRMRLAHLSPKFHKMCYAGEVSLGIALELCRIQRKDQCGCTESTPCLHQHGRCAWANKGKTLCTACKDPKKRKKGGKP